MDDVFNFGLDDAGLDDLETNYMPPSACLKLDMSKKEMRRMMKREKLAEVMPAKPDPGCLYNFISNGNYDFFTWIPTLAKYLGHVDHLYASTWTMNRDNVVELLGLMDAGQFSNVTVLTGIYFKRRETAVYARLLNGIQKRGHRFKALKNHAKITLMANEASGDFVCVQGSANWTANPRVEQYVMTNDRDIYDFHREWMEACF